MLGSSAAISLSGVTKNFGDVHAVRGVFPNDVTSQMPWRALTSIGVIALIPVATMIAMVTGWLATGCDPISVSRRPMPFRHSQAFRFGRRT